MNEYALLAFVVAPLFVVARGDATMRLHEWDLDRRHRNDPAE